MARWVKSHNQMRIFKQTATPAVVDGLKVGDIWIDINSGAILKLCTSISPVTFSVVSAADGNGNVSADMFLAGYTSTATSTGTTTLTVGSTQNQIFTGATTQTVVLPAVSTLALGTSFTIVNLSSGVVTVQSSGTNTVQAMQANSTLTLLSNAITGTGASVWDVAGYMPAASGQTGSGALVRAISPALVTPTLGAASATSMSFSSTSGIIGSTTNNSADDGSVGQVVIAFVDPASPISLTTGTITNVTSISLTAGDWDVYGNVGVQGNGSTLLQDALGWTNSVSASLVSAYLYNNIVYSVAGNAVFAQASPAFNVPMQRYSLGTTTSIFLTTYVDFTISTCTAYGYIIARRRR